MKKERVLTVILVVLVCSSVYMTFNLWVVKKLWPEGYNFFADFVSIINSLPTAASAPKHEEMYLPSKFVVNRSGTSRSVFFESDREFGDLNNTLKEILSALFKNENMNYININEKDYYETLKAKSIFVSYPVELPTAVIGQLLEVSQSPVFSQVTSVTELMILPGDRVTNQTVILMRDQKTSLIYKYFVKYPKADLEKLIDEYAAKKIEHMMSSYELKLYEWNGKGRNATLYPFVFLDTSRNNIKTPVIKTVNPLAELSDGTTDANKTNKILKAFAINPNTVNKYIDNEGNIVFIETYSTLKIYKNGFVEYKATEPRHGIKLNISTANETKSLLAAVDSVADIINSLWRAFDIPSMPDMRVASSITDKKYNSFTLDIDYQYGGLPVIIEPEGSQITHAIEAVIDNGELQSIRVCFRNYEDTNETFSNLQFIDAFNKSDFEGEAFDLFLGYIDDMQSPKINTCWNVKFRDNTVTPISNN